MIGHHSDQAPSSDFPNVIKAPETFLLTWSAKNETSLAGQVFSFEAWSKVGSNLMNVNQFLRNLAYTLTCRRTLHEWRSYVITDSVCVLEDLKREISGAIRSSNNPKSIFVFSGQGTQYQGMGLQLISWAVFRKALISCNDAFRSLGCKWSLLGIHDPFSQLACRHY